jgi:hypothetical protein
MHEVAGPLTIVQLTVIQETMYIHDCSAMIEQLPASRQQQRQEVYDKPTTATTVTAELICTLFGAHKTTLQTNTGNKNGWRTRLLTNYNNMDLHMC